MIPGRTVSDRRDCFVRPGLESASKPRIEGHAIERPYAIPETLSPFLMMSDVALLDRVVTQGRVDEQATDLGPLDLGIGTALSSNVGSSATSEILRRII